MVLYNCIPGACCVASHRIAPRHASVDKVHDAPAAPSSSFYQSAYPTSPHLTPSLNPPVCHQITFCAHHNNSLQPLAVHSLITIHL